MIRSQILLIAVLAATPLAPLRADGFFGLFGSDKDKVMPPKAELDRREAEARALAARAGQEAANGNFKKAAKLDQEAAITYPLSSVAPTCAFDAGRFFEQAGEYQDAFDAYQEFLTRFKGDKRYQAALDRQFALAMDCRDGKHSGKILGVGLTGVSKADAAVMLEKFIANNPRSRKAAQARIAIAEYHQQQGKVLESVAAYQKVVDDYPNTPEAAEAQYRIGQVYLARAQQKSKDRSTVTAAREAFEDYLNENPQGAHSGEVKGRLQSIGSMEAKEAFEVARFYERTHKPQAAAIYYREVLRMDSPEFAAKARERLDALGASGIKAPTFSDINPDMLPPLEEPLTKERDDYVGPPVPDLKPRLPSLRFNEPETLPGGQPGTPPGDSPLLDDGPPPPADGKPAEKETPVVPKKPETPER